LFAQGVVSGKVTSASGGEPLPGVNVIAKGTSNGTTTDARGSYSISVGSSDVLVFSFIGFKKIEVPVDNRTVVDVALEEDITSLSEVVVTALGIEKSEEKIGYSVSKVSGDLLNRARETNVAYSLSGRVAGLNVSGTNGGPGSSARILLRGMASFNASSPLFVINGVPIDNTQRGSAGEWGGADQGDGIANLNPDDIESMTVLKGAAASALYGARAANGVIVINTKSGRKSDFSVEYNMNYSVDKAIDFTNYQYEYGQGQNGVRPQTVSDALSSGGYSWGERLDGEQTIQFDGNSYPYSAVTDNIETFYRTAPTFTNTISVAKGGENGAFRLSLSNMDNKSILRNSGVKRKTINLNVNQDVTDKLNVSVMANYIDEASNNRPQLSDGPMNANNIGYLATNLNQEVLAPGYDEANNGAEVTWNDDIYVSNPWFVVNQYENDVDRKRLISAVTARYDFADWLFLQGRVGYDLLNDRYFQVTPWGTAYTNNRRGSLNNLSRAETSELNADVLLGIRRNITTDLLAEVSLGANLRRNKYETIGVSGGPFVLPYFYSFNNVETFNRSYDYAEKEAQSAYYTVELGYKNLLTLTTTGRYDAFSTLPSSDRSIFTPSVSASFIFSELVELPALSYGKLRASYGQTSGEPTDPYITSSYYSVGSTINGTTTGSFSSSLPNLFLKPFTLSEFEIGTEIKFFEGKLGFDVAYFHRKTKNEIINGDLSRATGYERQYIATGSTENSGVELLITGTPVATPAFEWNVSFNFTSVKNTILDIYGEGSTNTTLGLGTYRPLNANTALVKGEPGPQVMAYDYVRDDAGNIVVDADGIPLRGDLTPMGSVLPKGYGGLNNEFRYKSFNLSFLIDFKYGNKVLSATNFYSVLRGLNQMTLEGRETGVTVDGVHEDGSVNTESVAAQAYYQNLIRRISAISVLDGDFIKLRQVTLGYSLPDKIVDRLPFKAVNISFVARNLLLLTKNPDNIDPEAGFSPLIRYAGIEGNSLPSTRTYGFNLNVKF
jgi:TonB-linked SusC/RagA family outer membrane protein